MRWTAEPWRSRLFLVADAVLAAGFGALVVLRAHPAVFLSVTGGALVLLPLLVGVRLFRSTVSARPRPRRFVLARGGFGVPPLVPIGFVAGAPVLGVVMLGITAAVSWRTAADPPLHGPLIGVIALSVLAMVRPVYLAWNAMLVELVASGVRLRGLAGTRLVPWDALTPDGPSPPPRSANRLWLVAARPELVTDRGWVIEFGPRQRPAIPLQVDMSTVFLADAIRWYVEHPDDRASIGTRVAHDRLLAQLAGRTEPPYADLPRDPNSERPRPMMVATRLAYAAIAVGLAATTADLFIAVVFRRRLQEIDEATTAEELRRTGEPIGAGIGGADFALGVTVTGLVVAILLGVIALVLIRAFRYRADSSRRALTVLCGLVAVWAICPCGPPTLSLTDEAGAVGSAVLALWLLSRGTILALAVGVIIALYQSGATRFFRPA